VRLASVVSMAALTISSATCLIWSSPRPAAASSCSGGVGQLGRLVSCLLEQAAALGLRLAQLLRRVAVCVREQLARLVAGGVQHLRPLTFALLPVALDLRLAVLLFATAAPNLFFRLRELRLGSLLRIGLDRVGELGGATDEVEGIHPHCVPGRLDRLAAATRGLQHAQLSLKL